MRRIINPEMQVNETTIGEIEIDLNSRDDIPQILLGLQHIYMNEDLRNEVFKILEEMLLEKGEGEEKTKVDPNNGRPGMSQWEILVLGVLRLGLNADYDRILELSNQHKTIRQMLGYALLDEKTYKLQTLRDNLRLLTPEILDCINQVVVRAGHQALKKSPEDVLTGRCDSFVVETDVHYPTDTNLLLDAIRVLLYESNDLANTCNIPGWRQYAYHQRQFKRAYRTAQQKKHSNSKNEEKKKKKEDEIHEAHRNYLDLARENIKRTQALLAEIQRQGLMLLMQVQISRLETFMQYALHQIDLIERRVLQDESIPHDEKIFSLFQSHTEWIQKGKAGVSVELGLRVCILDDGHGFILHHQVMEKVTDEKVAITMVEESQKRFPNLRVVSMDKGFHSVANQQDLTERLDCLVLPKKGRLSQKQQEREADPEFRRLRRKHSAVESSINALEVHGLDICRDHGIDGFKRYVALAVVARNIHHLGGILRKQHLAEELRRREKQKTAA